MKNLEEVQTTIKAALKANASPKVYRRAGVNVSATGGYMVLYIPGSLTVKGSSNYFWAKESEEEITERVKFIASWSEDFDAL